MTTLTCQSCKQAFTDSPEDIALRESLSPVIAQKKYPIPASLLCHACVQQLLAAQGNQLHLYKRTCDFTKKPIVSNYHPNAPYPVYNLKTWWSDEWDAKVYGKEYDFTRPFFDQYKELLLVAPRFALHTTYEFDENSEYVNYCTKNKNCYLIFDSDLNENCYYSYSINRSRSSMDCYRIGQSELCYECVDCMQCYGSSYLQDCSNCHSSYFLKNCIGCKNCLFCCNLQNKEYQIENKQVTKEEFEKAVATLADRSVVEQAKNHFKQYILQFPQKMIHGTQNEDVSGDYLQNCKNAHECFDSRDLWDCRYNYQGWMTTKDAMHGREMGDCERAYMSCYSGSNANSLYFTSHCFESRNLLYSSFCHGSNDLFGCASIKRGKYCILNTQYTKEEYEALVPKIIEHMKSTGEWGAFMPMTLASFAYNESHAQVHFPLSKEEVLAKGLQWREDDSQSTQEPTAVLPATISGVGEEFAQHVFSCTQCRKNYRLTAQEIKLLTQMNIAPPDRCFFCRHDARIAKRNKSLLYDRACAKCQKPIQTTYSPDGPEIVYCESCYLESVY